MLFAPKSKTGAVQISQQIRFELIDLAETQVVFLFPVTPCFFFGVIGGPITERTDQ